METSISSPGKKVAQFGAEYRGMCSDLTQALDECMIHRALPGQVHPHHMQVDPAVKDLICRFRIYPDVELRCRSPVSRIGSSAHDVQASCLLSDSRFPVQSRCDIGQRSGCDERNIIRIHHLFNDEVHRVLLFRLAQRLGHDWPVHSALAMNIRCGDQLMRGWPCVARINWDLGMSDLFQHNEGISRHVGKIAVSAHCRDSQKIQMLRRQHDRKRVIMPRVAIQYHFSHICSSFRTGRAFTARQMLSLMISLIVCFRMP